MTPDGVVAAIVLLFFSAQKCQTFKFVCCLTARNITLCERKYVALRGNINQGNILKKEISGVSNKISGKQAIFNHHLTLIPQEPNFQ